MLHRCSLRRNVLPGRFMVHVLSGSGYPRGQFTSLFLAICPLILDRYLVSDQWNVNLLQRMVQSMRPFEVN